jgi:hypothetical protein
VGGGGHYKRAKSPRAITSGKINGSKPNSYFICNVVWQNNVPNIQ